jgi:DNA-3-methyladenine glycosylase
MRLSRPLARSFFARDADVVARDLLGRVLVHDGPRGRAAARIVETEAYFGPPGTNRHLLARRTRLARRLVSEGDPAAHSFVGPTERNRVMFGPPGYWYVYLVYGLHECANVVTGPRAPHEPQAVLLRAAEPIEGAERMARADLGGPARLCQAMLITRRAHYGLDATRPPLFFEPGAPVADGEVAVTPRVGIRKAAGLPLRFVVR